MNNNKTQFKHSKLTFIPRHKELYIYVNKSTKDLTILDLDETIKLRNFLNQFINNEVCCDDK